MKNYIILALALAFFATPAFATEGAFLSATQPSQVLAGESTFFDVTIWNNRSDAEWFSIAVYPSDWISISGGASALLVPSYGQKTFRVEVSPPADARGINYVYSISASAEKAGRVSIDVAVPVQQRYTGVLLSDFLISCSNCVDSVEVSAVVKNVGNSDLKDLSIALSAGDFSKTIAIESLRQGEEKRVSANFLVSKWKPGNYEASAKLTSPAGTDYKSAKFSVPEIKSVSITRNVQQAFWGSVVYVTAKNSGNVEDSAELKSEDPESQLIALYPQTKPSSITGNALTWYASLAPGEERTIIYSQVFWPTPFAILFAMLFAVYGYFAMTAIEIRKMAFGKGDSLGVSLHVKNRGADTDGVLVRDTVPSAFSVLPFFETAKPIMRKIAEGTELIWRIGTVKKGDEMVLHYKLKHSGRGGALPSAVLTGRRGMGLVHKTSNYAVVPRGPNAQAQKVKVVVEE